MNRMAKYKLLVQSDNTCMELLRYLNKNIITINEMGVVITIEKIASDDIDEELIDSLRRHGITRLPTLIDNNNKKIIGIKKILELFERNISKMKTSTIVNPSARQLGSTDLEDFYNREMMTTDDSGKNVPRTDGDDGAGESQGINFDKEMTKFMSRVPKGRASRADNQLSGGSGGGNTAPRRNPADNIATDDYDDDYDNLPPVINNHDVIMPSEDTGGDEMDRRMLDAYLTGRVA